MGTHSNWSIGPLHSSTNAKQFTALCYIKALPTTDSVGEGEGGKIWENGIETCK